MKSCRSSRDVACRLRRILYAFVVPILSACSGGNGTSSTPQNCDTPTDYTFLYACQGMSGANICTEYYANVPASAVVGLEQACVLTGGTVLNSPCPTADSLGTCTNEADSGLMGVYSVTTGYGSQSQATTFQNDCPGGYALPGAPIVLPNGMVAGGAQCPTMHTRGFAFSVPLRVNGETVSCTNYYGVGIDPAERTHLGGELDPCTTTHSTGSCENANSALPGATSEEKVSYGPPHGIMETAQDCNAHGGTFSAMYVQP